MRKYTAIPRFSDGLAASRSYITQTPGAVYAMALLAPALAMAAALWAGLTPTEMLRDPIMVAGGEPSQFYLGLFSNLGVVLWTAAAAICLFAGRQLTGGTDSQARQFLVYAGFFTLVLMLDDLFMLHENYGERLVYMLYGAGLLYYIVRFYKLILRLDVVLFVLCLPLFGNAVLLDLAPWRLLPAEGIEVSQAVASSPIQGEEIPRSGRELRYLLEDGFKFVGICCWAAFHIRAATKLLRWPGAVSVGTA